jgi:predicted DNA-binding protein
MNATPSGGVFALPPDLLETIEEQAERAEREAAVAKRRTAAKRLCGLAVLAVESLREGSPKLRQAVEAAIHDVGDAVLALDAFETAVRRYQTPTPEQRKAAAAVIEHAPLGWALEQVEKLVRAEQREQEAKRR